MDMSSLMGGGQGPPGGPSKEQKPEICYMAQAASPAVNGQVQLTVGEYGLAVTSLFDALDIPYAQINALSLADYEVKIETDGGHFAFSRMGRWAQPFYDALYDAYNGAVLRSLFVKGRPALTTKGECRFSEKTETGGGTAPIHVYEDCVVTLPPDLSARRTPLCFATGMDRQDYALTLRLDTGESYTYARLGYDTAPFADALEKQLRALREKSLAAVKELDPSLSSTQASRIAALMPLGAAAPMAQLAQIAPSFAQALAQRMSASRGGAYYAAFEELCDPGQIYVGFRKGEAAGGGNPLEALEGMLSPGDEEAEAAPADPYLLWLMAPSPDGQWAAVEFAQADSATFVYRTGGDFHGFAGQMNRALEAIDFQREVIRLSAEELEKPENADYHMAVKRTAALQFVRAHFIGRAIHSGREAWQHKLLSLWGG